MASCVKFCYSSVDVALHGSQTWHGPGHPGCNATLQVTWYLRQLYGWHVLAADPGAGDLLLCQIL